MKLLLCLLLLQKKRKVSKLNPQKPQMSLTGHKQVVTGVSWISNDEVVSGSWDFNICFWDLPSGLNTETKHGNKPITSLSRSPQTEMILTSHTDPTIRMWDKRTDKLESCLSFTSHTNWVSCVKFHPTQPHFFVSGSYDNTIKLWDTRSTTPLYTTKGHTRKVLSLTWFNDKVFLSGGADNLLQTHVLK